MASIEAEIDVKFLSRLGKYLPENDLTLIVLEGHLLVEEQLLSLVEQNLKHPTAIKNFRFFHRYALAKAMYYEKQHDSIWRSLKILNNLRNHLAHNLEAAELQTRAKQFIDSVEGFPLLIGLVSAGVIPDAEIDTIEQRLRHALIFICGRLHGLRSLERSS